MATIKVTCPKCSKPFGVLDRQMGTSVHCPHCRQRMTVGQRKAAAPGSPQEEAAAQLLGASPLGTASGAAAGSVGGSAADALEAAFGPPPKPKPAPKPVMAAPAPQPYQTRLAKNLGLDDEEVGGDHLLDNAPIHSRAGVWVWLSILGVVIIGLVVGIFFSYDRFKKDERAGAYRDQTILGEERAGSGPRQQVIRIVKDDQGNVIERVDETQEILGQKDRIHPDAMLDSGKSTLMPHWPDGPVSSYSFTRDNKQYDVWIGYVENVGTELVRRGTWALRFGDMETKEVYGEQTYWFNDVKPGEKAYFVLETLYAEGPNVKMQWAPQVPEEGGTDMPVFEFDVKPMSVERQGRTQGTVSFDVTNLSNVTAPAVDVMFLLYSRDKRPVAWAKTRIVNLVPHRPERAKAPWKDGHASFGVDHVGFCRAQVVETGAAK